MCKLYDAFETNRALDEIRKKVYDYKELTLSQNRELTVNSFREKWLVKIKIIEPCFV